MYRKNLIRLLRINGYTLFVQKAVTYFSALQKSICKEVEEEDMNLLLYRVWEAMTGERGAVD